jgi:hypothetical protein
MTTAPPRADLWTETVIFGVKYRAMDRGCTRSQDGNWHGMFRDYAEPLAWRPYPQPPEGED